MIEEIYIRTQDDPKYNETILDHSSELEMLLGKIMMILKTRKGEVLGDPAFGVSLEDYLFTFDVDENRIRREIAEQISIYAPESSIFNIEIEIKRFKGSVRDMILIDFIVDGRKSLGLLVK
jgi:phage baseplate assembly protein W